jgi:hypothetical protein
MHLLKLVQKKVKEIQKQQKVNQKMNPKIQHQAQLEMKILFNPKEEISYLLDGLDLL